MIGDPEDRVASSDFGDLMSFCNNLTALHILRHLPDESMIFLYPDPQAIYRHILLTASTLQILNIGQCIYQRTAGGLPTEFFTELTALREFRCDTRIVMHDPKPLDYLSAETWTLRRLADRDDLSLQELSIQNVSSFPLSYPATERLRRLNLDITEALPRRRWETENEDIDGVADGDLDSHGLQGADGEGSDLQKNVLNLLPPSVTYLSLICHSWEDLRGHIQRLPTSVTSLGLEVGTYHGKDKSYRHLIHICREIIAPRLTVIQLNHWQTCVDLRTRHPGILKEFVEMLRNRNVALWDAEGSVMKSMIP
ncbi:hypothetical protein ONZ45_g10463 [Pleurotus djamor]|nr:hypothetical protein ONZ45_g10463 [Pleurotus djamor]